MKLKFLGAAGTVTGSSYMLTSQSGESILIDSGMFQGTHEVDALNYSALIIDPSTLLGIVLTHAHLDHCGRLPFLVKNGFNKQIWMTPPTNEITNISLYDTAKLGKNRDNGALYTATDVDNTVSLFTNVDYGKEFTIGPFKITLRDAGHIIGSASVEVIDTTSTGEIKKIVFSGDLGNSPEPLIKPTELIKSADCVVVESTYGDRLHPVERAQEKLQVEINSVEVDGGVLLIPAFSIERSQEILHIISHLKKSGKVKNETEVVFDGPMGEKVTDVFQKYRTYYNQELTDDLKESDPFEFPGLNEIHKYNASIEEQETGGPKVVIAGSGMMSGGRIVEYAAKFLPLTTTRILFVGYQAEGTLGRKILDGQKLVHIQGVEVEIRAEVGEVQALSSHADQNGLMNWLKYIQGLKKVFVGHGENTSRAVFAEKIKTDLKISDIVIPNLNDEVNF
jgi:metallo-beta-lactamase family protein